MFTMPARLASLAIVFVAVSLMAMPVLSKASGIVA
jgi:hypothetical protein